jgi:hypothetical protein
MCGSALEVRGFLFCAMGGVATLSGDELGCSWGGAGLALGLDETAAAEASSAVSAWRRFFIDDGWRGGTDASIDATMEEPKIADEEDDAGEDAERDEEEEEESARARGDDDAATVPTSEFLADAAAPAARAAEAAERSPGRVRPMRVEEGASAIVRESKRSVCANVDGQERTRTIGRKSRIEPRTAVSRPLRRVRLFFRPSDLWTDDCGVQKASRLTRFVSIQIAPSTVVKLSRQIQVSANGAATDAA